MPTERSALSIATFRLALQTVCKYVPPSVRTAVLEGKLPEIEDLYQWDRHYLCVAACDRLLDFITEQKQIEAARLTAAASSASGSTVSLCSEDANGVVPLPSLLPPSSPLKGSSGEVDETSVAAPCVQSAFAFDLLLRTVKNSTVFTECHRKADECRAMVRELRDDTLWKPIRVDKLGHGTFYKEEKGMSSHSFKVIGIVNQGMVSLASVIIELDLYKEWFPFCNRSEEIGSVSRFHKLSRFEVSMPWPVANREVCIGGYGVDDLENKLVYVKAAGNDDGLQMPNGEMPPHVKKGCVRADVKSGGFILESLGETTTKVTFMMNIDPKMKIVPMWLINWVSGKMFWVLLHQISKAADKGAKEGSCYAERRKLRPDVYDYFSVRATNALGTAK